MKPFLFPGTVVKEGMKGCFGVSAGAIAGFVAACCLGQTIYHMIWAHDMEGQSGVFTVFVVAPIFTILGAIVVGLLWRSAK